MRKHSVFILVMVILLLLTACGEKTEVVDDFDTSPTVTVEPTNDTATVGTNEVTTESVESESLTIDTEEITSTSSTSTTKDEEVTTEKSTTTSKKKSTTTKITTTTKKKTTSTKVTTTKKKTTTKSTKATKKVSKYKTIELYVKTTYFGCTGYFYKATTNGVHNLDPTIVGLPADHPNFSGVCTEYHCVDDGIFIWFALDFGTDWSNMDIVSDGVFNGGGRYKIPVKVKGDIQYKSIKLREKTTYMGYTGYFYETENLGRYEDDPTILGLPANTPIISNLPTEYYDVYTNEKIFFAMYCPNYDGDSHSDECSIDFEDKVYKKGEPFQILATTDLVE